MRIVQVANFVHERSGGIRTSVDALGAEYAAAGHDVMTIWPGPRHDLRTDELGRTQVRLPGAPLPASGGYRVFLRRGPLSSIVASWRPDLVEVNDRTTLTWLGRLARHLGAASTLISHERLDLVMGDHLGAAALARRMTCWHRRNLDADFDLVVCPSRFAAAEFEDEHPVDCAVVPLGVDLDQFHPDHRVRVVRPPEPQRVLLVSRLSREKHPMIAVRAVEELRHRGVDVELLVAGDGPMREQLAAAETGSRMLGHVHDRHHLAALLADADAVIAPGARETFGLAALEALASGTPVVAADQGALRELLAPGAGVVCKLDPRSFADGLAAVLAGDRDAQRVATRTRAEQFRWDRAGRDLLARYAALTLLRRRVA